MERVGGFRGSRSAANVNTARRQSAAAAAARERELQLQLLVQITDFVARKQQQVARHGAASDWRRRSSSCYSNKQSDGADLFSVVVRVCEDRMQRLSDENEEPADSEWTRKAPRVLVAEAMVQELLVSLVEIQLSEKEEMILDEVDAVDVMRQLHAQLAHDEHEVRHRVCSAAGDEQQLQELQAALRSEFLQEVAHTRATQRLNDATQHSDASLQFAWETIQEQKKEVVRLRAENQELRSRGSHGASRDPVSSSASSSRLLDSSLFADESPASAIHLLRSQLSTHHETNLSILHDYIRRLEDALRRATSARDATGDASTRDLSGATFDSSRGEKENWRPRDDFARTQPNGRRGCEQCKRGAGAMVALQSEAKQLRAQVAADEESLVRAEKEQLQRQRENAALSSALRAAKQQQEELRQMILDVTHEKRQAQSQSEAELRASERTVRRLRDELDGFDERSRRQARKLERLELEVGSDARKQQQQQRAFSATRRSEDSESAAESNGVLRERVACLQREVRDLEALARDDSRVIDELRATVGGLKQANARRQELAPDRLEADDDANATVSSLEAELERCRQQCTALESQASSLQSALAARDAELMQRDTAVAELKQDKLVLGSLQAAEREKRLRCQHELERERSSLRERADAATADCEELREALEAEKTYAASLTTRLRDAELALQSLKDANAALGREARDAASRRESLEAHVGAEAALQLEVERLTSANAAQTAELEAANAVLGQEIADAKTTILMWMSKYNTLSARLEDDAQCAAEDRFSLQRQLESMAADHKRHAQDERRRLEAKRTLELAAQRETAAAELQTLTAQFEAKLAALERRGRDQQLEAQTLQSDLSRSRSCSASELAQLRASTLELESQVAVLKDANRGLQFELRSEERQRKTLGFLVETLQERPVLQRRALHEMLAASQRQLELVFRQLFTRVEETGQQLRRVQHTCAALSSRRRVLRLEAASAKATTGTGSQAHGVEELHQDAHSAGEAHAPDVVRMLEHLAERSECEALRQIVSRAGGDWDVVQQAESVLVRAARPSTPSAAYDARDSRLRTVECAAPESSSPAIVRLRDAATQANTARRAANLRRWRFVVSATLLRQRVARNHHVSLRIARRWVRAANAADDAGRQAIRWKWRFLLLGVRHHHEALEQRDRHAHWRWKALAHRVETQQLAKTTSSLLTSALRHRRRSDVALRQSERRIRELELERERSAALSPVSAVALGNCVRLLQKFCDDTDTPAAVGASRATLAKYLVESNCKIAGWRRTLDRKLEEFSDRKEQLQRLHARCAEMKELVALNQRLVRELERKAGSQQAVVDAAVAFARAYKTLRMSVSSQMFTTTEFYQACKRVVEVVHASSSFAGGRPAGVVSVVPVVPVPLPSAASSNPAAPSAKVERGRRLRTLDEEAELTASQAAASIVSSNSSSNTVRAATLVTENSEDVERRRRATSEQAVGLLKSANEIREKLERALAERTAALHQALAQLETKRLQFVVLRSFLRWKFTTYALRMAERQA